jgi:two-component system, OmpR family, response regulator
MESDDINVLLVEDEKLLNWSLSSSLAKWGFAVQPVFTGNDAVAQFERSGFDVVLLDYRLPDVDGLAVARLMRERRPAAKIFLLTSFQLNELSPDAGLIDNYFNKPLDLQQLHKALAEIKPGDRAGRVSKRVPVGSNLNQTGPASSRSRL